MQRLLVILAIVATAAPCVAQLADKPSATVAVIYYWKAKPGKLEEYNRYIKDVAEPVDMEAQRQGAFVSITTFVSQKPDSPWTHMRIFILRDHVQAEALKSELDAAGARVVPDPAKRKANSDYAATLRELVGSEEASILK